MLNSRLAKYFFLITTFLSLVIPIFYYNHLPDRVATHFDFRGNADNYSSKSSMMIIEYGIIIFSFLLFMGIQWLIPRMPKSSINLPNKEYWLDDSRREDTLSMVSGLLNWIGTFTIVFITLIMILSMKANLDGSFKLGSYFWMLIILFIASTSFIIYRFISYFNKKEN